MIFINQQDQGSGKIFLVVSQNVPEQKEDTDIDLSVETYYPQPDKENGYRRKQSTCVNFHF